jgi:DNA adenine methylase
MVKNQLASPVVKWAGGKRQLLGELLPRVPRRFGMYCEPFLGGGAMLLALQPAQAEVNDLNADLIAVYETIRDDVEVLIASLARHENTPEYFYTLRDADRHKEAYRNLPKVEKASRLLYLNKTCFNGLFRVNATGEFNAPFGYYKHPNIVNAPVLRAVSCYFNQAAIGFGHRDFTEVLADIPRGSFVYLDPPYDPVSDTANFTGYNQGGFSRDDQVRLRQCCEALSSRGILFMLSNSDTPFIRELYRDFHIEVVRAKRAINANGRKRGAVEEVIVRNYGD